MKNQIQQLLNVLSVSREGGYITESSLGISRLSPLLEALEPLQETFLKNYKLKIPPSYAAKWPVDKLHWWSRPQEYAFVLFHALSVLEQTNGDIEVLEFGPGCSFIPHTLGTIGGLKKLSIAEIDDNVVAFWKGVGQNFGLRIDAINTLREEKQFDLIYSVSVVEHVSSPVSTVKDLIHRLKPKGRIILTLDIDCSGLGHYGLTINQLSEILQFDEVEFEYLSPVSGCPHVRDIATPRNGWRISPKASLGGPQRILNRTTKFSLLRRVFSSYKKSSSDSADICVLKLIGHRKCERNCP